MNIVSTIPVFLLIFSAGLSGCAITTMPVTDVVSSQGMIPVANPSPVKTIEIWDAQQQKRIETDVLSLKSADIRGRMTATETIISIQKRDTSGSLTYLGASGKVSKGSYRVTFDYSNWTNQPIAFEGGGSALGRIGVGLRITADLVTLENGIDLGGLLPIGIAARDRKVTGQLSFLAYGLSNDKVAIAVPSQSILDESSIQKSFEAAATVRVLFGLDDTKLEPWLMGVSDVKTVDAPKALQAAVQTLTK